jgi:hypothetical protein
MKLPNVLEPDCFPWESKDFIIKVNLDSKNSCGPIEYDGMNKTSKFSEEILKLNKNNINALNTAL